MRPLIALVLLLLSAPVAAAKGPVARDDVIAGPVLAGSRVVWGSTEPGGAIVVRAGAPGAAPTSLFTFAPLDAPSEQVFGGIAASATHLAMVRAASRPTGDPEPVGEMRRDSTSEIGVIANSAGSTTLVAGPLGGPFLKVSGRRAPRVPGRRCRPAVNPSGPALWGSVLAYVENETLCTRDGERVRDRIVVRDLARPAAPPRVVARGTPSFPGAEPRVSVGTVRLAGRYVAWQEIRMIEHSETRARVLDLRSGRIVRTVDRGPGGEPGDVLEWFDVGPDGSLVVSFQPDAEGHALALVDRRGRAGTVTTRPPSGAGGYEPPTVVASYRRGRIGFIAETGRDEVGLVLARRTGLAAPLARFRPGNELVGEPAWNGVYAAWASRRRGTTTIWRSGPHR